MVLCQIYGPNLLKQTYQRKCWNRHFIDSQTPIVDQTNGSVPILRPLLCEHVIGKSLRHAQNMI